MLDDVYREPLGNIFVISRWHAQGMRESANDLVRRSGLPACWNGQRSDRDRVRGRARGLLRAPVATSVGYGFRVGKGVYIGVAPTAELIVGNRVTLYDNVRLNVEAPEARLTLGDGAFLNFGSQVFCRQAVTVGAGCAIGFDCLLMDTNLHALDGDDSAKAIILGEHVWLGARVTVLPGVSIGSGAVVAAGSIVTKDLPPGMLSVGTPAHPLRRVQWTP